MKIGKLTNTNSKGQLVIPQEYRNLFGITEEITLNIAPKATGIFIQPIEKVVPNVPTTDMYGQILKRTTEAWRGDDFE